MVGDKGLEPSTSRSQTARASQLRQSPLNLLYSAAKCILTPTWPLVQRCYTGLMGINMILRLAVACFFVGSTIFFAEVARANKWVSGERARKIIHILVGIWGAWLPIWLGWRSIIVLGFILLAGIAATTKLKWFKSIHSVTRRTVGEYLFPVSMIILALFFRSEVAFAAAMLQLGIADGFAAVIGTRYGRKTRFKILGQTKSWHGTLTFLFCSSAIIFWALNMVNPGLVMTSAIAMIVGIAMSIGFGMVLTIAELTSVRGLDNLSIPLLTAFGLMLFAA